MTLIRVCLLCKEKKGTLYLYMSIHGCKNETETKSCKYCRTFTSCQLRLVNPSPNETTHGYCESCMDSYYDNLQKERNEN